MFALTPFDRMTRRFISYDPFKELAEMEKRFFGSAAMPAFRTDIREIENAYVLEAELPGFSKEDIRAEIKENVLTISAEHKTNHETQDEQNHYVRRERSYGSYQRSFDLSGIEITGITAAYENGILSLTLPKQEEKKPDVHTLEIH